MVKFEPVPSASKPKCYRMETLIPTSTANTLKTIRDLEGNNVTEVVRKVVSMYKWYDDCRINGNLLIAAQPQQLEVLEPPATVKTGENEEHAKLSIKVSPSIKSCLEVLIPDDLMDESGFWKAAVVFYSSLMEKQLLGSKFYCIAPGLSVSQFHLDDPFASDNSAPTTFVEWRWLNLDFVRRLFRKKPPG